MKTIMQCITKRLATMLLFAAATLMPQVANAAGTQPSGSGTTSSPYQIATASNLLWFADAVNGGNNNICAKLTADITLSGETSDYMIGTKEYGFKGEFDGQGHTISGVNVTTTKIGKNNYLYAGGLFGCIDVTTETPAVVKNVTVEGSVNITGLNTHYYVGGVIAIAWGYVNISNVVSKVNVTTTTKNNAKQYAHCGGVLASVEWFEESNYKNYLTMSNCVNYGTLNVACGDICGGVVGYVRNGSITDCLNVGNITNSTDCSSTSGVLGYTNDEDCTMSRCLNVGTVTNTGNSSKAYAVYFAKNNNIGAVSDLYYKSGTAAGTSANTTAISEANLKSGSLGYTFASNGWGQSIGNNSVNDAYPIPNKTDYKVYQTGSNYCNNITSTIPTGDFTTTIETTEQYKVNRTRVGDTKSFTVKPTDTTGKYIAKVTHNGNTLSAQSVDGNVKTYSYTVALNNDFVINVLEIGCTTTLNQSTIGTAINLADNTLGSTETFTATPNVGYYITGATINGSTVAGTAVTGKTDGTKSFSFTVKETNTVTINTADIGCTTTLNQSTIGTAINLTDNTVGSTETFTVTPKVGYYITGATINGETVAGTAVTGKTDGTKSFSFTVKETNTVTINTEAVGYAKPTGSGFTTNLPDVLQYGSTVDFWVKPKVEICTLDATYNSTLLTPYRTDTDRTKHYKFTVATDNVISFTTTPHNYDNDFCTNCGSGHSATLDSDGYYAIADAAHLHWFAEKVNSGETTIKGKLTADIELSGVTDDYVIGTYEHPFKGVFDGGKHTISGVNVTTAKTCEKDTECYQYAAGLFGCINASGGTAIAVVKDLTVDGKLNITGLTNKFYAGGVIAIAYGNVNVSNIISRLIITVGSNEVKSHCGGVIASSEWFGSTNGNLNVSNCVNYSIMKVSCSDVCGGVVGYVRRGSITNCLSGKSIINSADGYTSGVLGYVLSTDDCTISRCLNFGSVTNTINSDKAYSVYFAKSGNIGTVTDLYYMSGVGGEALNATEVSEEQLSSGEVAWLLNGCTAEGDVAWHQNLGWKADAYPVLDSSHGRVYYGYECDRLTYSNKELTATPTEHQYDTNGLCTNCGSGQPAMLGSDGYYEIANAGQLYWFAGQVNEGATTINAKLTADIVVNHDVLKPNGYLNGDGSGFKVWTPIGIDEDGKRFDGTFDGQGHTISGLYIYDLSKIGGGLFCATDENSVIKNVGLVDSYFYLRSNVGGICGSNGGTVENCNNAATCRSNGKTGGIVAWNSGTIANCENTGLIYLDYECVYSAGVCAYNEQGIISASNNAGRFRKPGSMMMVRFGGVCGLNNRGTITMCHNTSSLDVFSYEGWWGGVCGYSNNGYITNCYNTAMISYGGENVHVGGVCGRSYGDTISNCFNAGAVTVGSYAYDSYAGSVCGSDYYATFANDYYLEGTSDMAIGGASSVPEGISVKNAEQFASGEVAWLLNGSTAEGEVAWYQNISENADAYPVLDSSHGKVYYGYASCGYSQSYSNNPLPASPGHNYDADGFCSNCGSGHPATHGSDGFYEIANAGQLYWFAEQVNSGNYGINAKLTADIVVNTNVLNANGNLNGEGEGFRTWTPIGIDEDDKRFDGTFDGQGHTVSGLYINDEDKSVVGLFCATGANSVIKNVGIVDSYFYAYQHVAGICGSNGGLVENCFNAATCQASDNGAGGIVSWNGGTIVNCYNRGLIAGTKSAAVCYNNLSGTVTNSYYLEGTAPRGVYWGFGETTEMIADQFSNGEVAWLLNGSEAGESPVWRQTIGEDQYPVLDANKGIVIYSTKTVLNPIIRPTAGTLVGASDVYNFAGIEDTNVYGIEHTGTLAAEHPYVFTSDYEYVNFVPSDEEVMDNTETCGLIGVLDPAGKKVYGKDNTAGADVSIVFTADALKYANTKGNLVKYGKCYIDAGECFITSELVPAMAKSIANFGGDPMILDVEISNATELYAFAEQVNSGNTELNAKLTADIVVNEDVLDADGNLNADGYGLRVWTPIGKDQNGKKYEGTFDGQGHTISGLYINDEEKSVVGLFCTTGASSVIKNVGITDSYFRASQHVAGICGSNGGTVENCFNAATCQAGDEGSGGIVSWNGGTIANCYNKGLIAGVDAASVCYNNEHGNVTNCYYLRGTATCGTALSSGEATAMDAEQFASGEVAWLLNGSEAGESPVWRQTIGVDEYPVLDAACGIVVKTTTESLNSIVRPTAGTLVGATAVYNFAGIQGTAVYGIPQTGTLAAAHPYVFMTDEKYVSFVPSDEEVTDNTPTCGLTGVLDPAGVKVYGNDESEETPVSIVFTADALKYANPNGNLVKYGKCYINAGECFISSAPAMASKIAPAFEDGVDALENVSIDSVEGETYNLQGIPVGDNYKGFIIKNGRKLLRR